MISINDGFGEAGAPGGGAEYEEYLADEIHDVFSETGLLSKSSNFAYRPQQQEMAVAVAETLERKSVLSVEAGTGVGKSLAYLIPAVKFAIEQGPQGSDFYSYD